MIPSFLSVTFTVALPEDLDKPLNVIVLALFVIETWSLLNDSVVPSL